MNNFGEFLYALRKEKGITQAELADELGVTNKAVSKWETCEAMPETSLLLPISRIFDVTVDELLEGKRAQNVNDAADENQPAFDCGKHLFTRGKDDKPEKLSEIICGIVCAAVFLLGVAVYLFIGALFGLWTPYWVIIPVCALTCGIIGIIFDLSDADKRREKREKGENPYVGAICGFIMLTCIIVYLLLGALLELWHPCWIIVAGGAICCGLIGSFGMLLSHKKK